MTHKIEISSIAKQNDREYQEWTEVLEAETMTGAKRKATNFLKKNGLEAEKIQKVQYGSRLETWKITN